MSLFSSPLLALDVEVIVKIVLFLLFIGGSLITKLLSSLTDAQRAKKASRPNPAVRPVAVDREIDEFRRQSPTSRIPDRNPPPAPPKAPNQKSSSKSKKGANSSGAKKRLVPATEVAPAERSRDNVSAGRSVSDHVQRHLSQGGLGQRASHLAETIDQADERMEGHLHQMFDHAIGQLNRQASAQVDQGTDAATYDFQGEENSTLAKRIHEMLRNPQTANVAVILNEVLRRPEERWN